MLLLCKYYHIHFNNENKVFEESEGDLLKAALLCPVDIKNQMPVFQFILWFFPPDPLLLMGDRELSSGCTDSVCGCNTKTRWNFSFQYNCQIAWEAVPCTPVNSYCQAQPHAQFCCRTWVGPTTKTSPKLLWNIRCTKLLFSSFTKVRERKCDCYKSYIVTSNNTLF